MWGIRNSCPQKAAATLGRQWSWGTPISAGADPSLSLQSKPSSWALLWDFGTTTSRLMNNQWLGFICLEAPKVWVFQTSASASWAVTESHLLHPRLTRSTLHQSCFTLVKVFYTSVLTAHRPSASCTSAWTRIKRFQFPSNKEMNGTRPGCQKSSACWNLSPIPGERGNCN